MSTASPGIAFRAAPSERCPVTPCASRTFAWQVYVLLHGDNVLTDILVAIDAAVHVQGLQAAKVRESVFKLSSCLQSTLKFSSPAARYRCIISSPAAGLGRAIFSTFFWSSRCTFSWKEPARTRRRLVVVLAASHSSPACGCRPRRLAASRRRHSPYRRHRRHIDGVAAAAPATPADLCSLPPPPRIGHRPMGIALFLHHVCAMAVCVGECVPVCTACGGLVVQPATPHGRKNQRIPCFEPLKVPKISGLQAHVEGPDCELAAVTFGYELTAAKRRNRAVATRSWDCLGSKKRAI